MVDQDMKAAWSRVGEELSSLGLKLKYHAEQELSDAKNDADDEMGSALQRLGERLDALADAVENAARDRAVRDDVREAGRRLQDALAATVDQARQGLRQTR